MSWARQMLRHRLLPWTTLTLALTSYILTVGYLSHFDLVSRDTVFGLSPASALGTANGLSWTANTLLAASIGQSLDLTRAMLIARHSGHCLLDDLPLQSGTGIDGLFEIIWKWKQFGRYNPGGWSMFRLMTMVIVPALGIIVLSNVQPVLIYFQETTQNITRGYGIGPFNASLAALLQPMADSSFGTRFQDFLSDEDLVVNVSNETDTAGCASGLVNDSHGPCRAKYFVPGGIEQFAPRLLVGDSFTNGNDIQPVLAKNLTGYYLQFEASNATEFNQQTDCMKYGYSLASYQLCLKDVGAQKMSAFLRPCPKSLAVNLQCVSNATWPLDSGWGTTLEVNTRPADVVYNGLNGTILDYHFLTENVSPVNIRAPVLLQVFSTLFNTANTTSAYGKTLAAIGIASNKPVEPFIVWQYFQGLAELAKNDKRANARAQIGLQSLLTIPIYHCQAKDFAELRHLLLEQISNTTAIVQSLGQDLVNQFPVVEPDTDIFPAVMRYKLQVGQSFLVAYIVLTGVTLLLCLIACSMSSCTSVGRRFRHMSPFPALAQMYDYKIVSEDDVQLSNEDETLKKTANMYLHLVNKQSLVQPRNDLSGAAAESFAGSPYLAASSMEKGLELRRLKTI